MKISTLTPLLIPCLALSALAPGLLRAQAPIKMITRPDGTTLIYNEPAEARQRRQQDHLVPVPDEDLVPIIDRHADRHRLETRLVRAVIQVESGYNAAALSNKGAQGLMQLMPETAVDMAVTDPWDPEENIAGGTAYLRRMLDRFGRLDRALAAYNAGPGVVERYDGIPPYPETRAYVARVLSLYTGEPTMPESFASPRQRGRTPVLVRDAEGRLLITTSPPDER